MKKFFPSNIFQALLLLFIGLIVTAPFVLVSEKYLKHLSVGITNTITFVLYCIIIICIAKIVNSKRKIDINYAIEVPRKFWRITSFAVLIVIIFQAGVNLPLSRLLSYYVNGKSVFGNPFNQIHVFLGAIFLAPIFEELIFRGIILKGFLTKYTPSIAIVLSGILFCAIHVQPLQLLGALFFGVFSGWIYYKTESLGLCILFHFISNLSSQLISYALFKASFHGKTSLPYIYGPYTIILIGISILILFYVILKTKKEFITIQAHSQQDAMLANN